MEERREIGVKGWDRQRDGRGRGVRGAERGRRNNSMQSYTAIPEGR